MVSTSRKNFLNLLSYISVIAIGLAITLSMVFSWIGGMGTVVKALNIIAELLSYVVVGVYSGVYAFADRKTWVKVVWIVAVVLIVVFRILHFWW